MVKYRITYDLNLAIFSLTGTVTAKEIIQKVQLLKTDGRIHPGMNAVIDTREQINIFTRDEILKIFFEMVGVDKNPFIRKTAVLAVSNEEFGTGKIYSVSKNEKKVEAVVFSDINALSKWLGIPEGERLF